MCEPDCRFSTALSGLLGKRYYPSSPKRPEFAIHEDVLELYHLLKIPKSRFCHALQAFLETRTMGLQPDPPSATPSGMRDGRAQMPKAQVFYTNFRSIYTAWVDVRSIMAEKIETELSTFAESRSHNIQGQFDNDATITLGPTRLNRLCPACNNGKSERTAVCFDGNFQIKTLKRPGHRTQEVSKRDLRDRRLFIHDLIPDDRTSAQVPRLFLDVLIYRNLKMERRWIHV